MIEYEQINDNATYIGDGDRFIGAIRKLDGVWKYSQNEYQTNSASELRAIADKLESLNKEEI